MMKRTWMALALLFTIGSLAVAWNDELPGAAEKKPEAADSNETPAAARLSGEDARRQAEMLHAAMHATLQVVHHQYYRENEGLPIPAATLKEVFKDLEQEQQVTLRWLAVDGQAMNSDHKPSGPFDDEAVKALKSGKREFETTENGVYRRAGAITLTNHCLKCHMPNRKSTQDRTAGLVITIPLEIKRSE